MKELQGEMKETGTEWAEVCFVPDAICHSKRDPVYRYVATRELLKQPELPGLSGQVELPFPTMTIQKKHYKIFGIVSNRDTDGSELVNWLHKRCGKSEEAHAIMKEDLFGGKVPSSDFGENAAWWWIVILTFNLNVLMKRLVLNDEWTTRRMKALRFQLIDVAGTLLTHAGRFVMKLSASADVFRTLTDMRRTILALEKPAPT